LVAAWGRIGLSFGERKSPLTKPDKRDPKRSFSRTELFLTGGSVYKLQLAGVGGKNTLKREHPKLILNTCPLNNFLKKPTAVTDIIASSTVLRCKILPRNVKILHLIY